MPSSYIAHAYVTDSLTDADTLRGLLNALAPYGYYDTDGNPIRLRLTRGYTEDMSPEYWLEVVCYG